MIAAGVIAFPPAGLDARTRKPPARLPERLSTAFRVMRRRMSSCPPRRDVHRTSTNTTRRKFLRVRVFATGSLGLPCPSPHLSGAGFPTDISATDIFSIVAIASFGVPLEASRRRSCHHSALGVVSDGPKNFHPGPSPRKAIGNPFYINVPSNFSGSQNALYRLTKPIYPTSGHARLACRQQLFRPQLQPPGYC